MAEVNLFIQQIKDQIEFEKKDHALARKHLAKYDKKAREDKLTKTKKGGK